MYLAIWQPKDAWSMVDSRFSFQNTWSVSPKLVIKERFANSHYQESLLRLNGKIVMYIDISKIKIRH